MNDEIITEALDLSWDIPEHREVLLEMEDVLMQSYGLTYNQYIEIRNPLLKQYNYELPTDVLRVAITNKITIDLVSKGFLEIDSIDKDLMFRISEKGIQALHSAYNDGKLPKEKQNPFYALMFVRNSNLLKENK